MQIVLPNAGGTICIWKTKGDSVRRNWDDLLHRAIARGFLEGPAEMQIPHPGVSSEELLRRAVLDPTALGLSHGPQEDTVTTNTAVIALGSPPDAPTRKERAREARKYRLRTVVIMTFVGVVIGGFAGWGIVYYRDWWFSDELKSTRAFLVPASIVVGFILFLILVKIPLALVRRSRENRELRIEVRDLREEMQEWRSRTGEVPVVVVDDRAPSPLPARVTDTDPAMITPRTVPTPRPAPVRGGAARSGALRTTMGDGRPPQVGDTRPAPPLRTVEDLEAGGVVDDDDFDVPEFLQK